MAPPFRISAMQPTMEPLEEVLANARALERNGFHAVWLAETYPWWRKHSLEARSATALSPLVARETERLVVGWGVISPYARHPVQIAMEARVMQEVAGPGRFYLGLGASKIFMKHMGLGDDAKPGTAVRESVEIVRAVLEGRALDFEGKVFAAHVPPLRDEAHSPRGVPPIYLAGTGPRLQRAAGELADGLLTASITTPPFLEYARANMEEGARRAGRDPGELDLGATLIASIDEDRDRGRAGAREMAAMYLANKVQNIQAAADVLLEKASLSQDEIRPIAEAMDRGGLRAAKALVTDAVLDKCKPVAGTPSDCIAAIEEYRAAGCTHLMLEIWGDRRLEQIELFGRKVLPRFRER